MGSRAKPSAKIAVPKSSSKQPSAEQIALWKTQSEQYEDPGKYKEADKAHKNLTRLGLGGRDATAAQDLRDEERMKKTLADVGGMKDAIAEKFPLFKDARTVMKHPAVGALMVGEFATKELAKYQDSVAESGIASRAAYEDLSGRGQTAASVKAQLGAQSDSFHRDLEGIRNGKSTAAEKFSTQAKEQNLDAELEEQAIGADLDKDLAEIDTGELSEAQKIQARSKAQQKARRRKGERSLNRLHDDAKSAKATAENAGSESKSAAEAADAMQMEVQRRELLAQKATEEAGSVDGAHASQRKENNELIEFVRLMKQNSGSSFGNLFGKAGNAFASLFSDKAGYLKLKERFGDVSDDARLEEIEQEMVDQNKGFDHTKQMAEQNAAEKRRLADSAKAKQDGLRETAKKAAAMQVEAEALAEANSAEYEKRKTAWDSNEAKRTAAEELRVTKAMREAEEKNRNKPKGEVATPGTAAATGGNASSEAVTAAGAQVVGAITQNTQVVVGTLKTLVDALEKQNTSIAAIQADIAKLSGGNRGALRTC